VTTIGTSLLSPNTTERPRLRGLILVPAAIAAGVLAAGVAAGSTAQGAVQVPASTREETIRVVATGGAEGSLDIKPAGDSIGDYFAFNSTLEDLSGKRVGRVDGYSILTGTGNALAYLHFVTATLPGGQITTQNTELPEIDDGNGPEAITGGTGRYQGVGGQVTFEDQGDRVVIVIHLIR